MVSLHWSEESLNIFDLTISSPRRVTASTFVVLTPSSGYILFFPVRKVEVSLRYKVEEVKCLNNSVRLYLPQIYPSFALSHHLWSREPDGHTKGIKRDLLS